jgi:radical SAM enzyme (TIGR01210 family)
VGLQPCFVAPGTLLAEAFHAGDYRPPWLWSAVEVVRRVADLGPVHVALSDEGLEPAMAAHNCPDCTDRVRAALDAFNRTTDPGSLDALDCTCRAEWQVSVRQVG